MQKTYGLYQTLESTSEKKVTQTEIKSVGAMLKEKNFSYDEKTALIMLIYEHARLCDGFEYVITSPSQDEIGENGENGTSCVEGGEDGEDGEGVEGVEGRCVPTTTCTLNKALPYGIIYEDGDIKINLNLLPHKLLRVLKAFMSAING